MQRGMWNGDFLRAGVGRSSVAPVAGSRLRLRIIFRGRCFWLLQNVVGLFCRAWREIDVVMVWRLDRWGRSVADLVSTLQELQHLGVGFVSLTEALDLTTPAGRAMASLLAVFAEFEREILCERVRAGLAHAREKGQRLGRPQTAALHASQVWNLYRAGVSKAEIARRLQIGRTSVRRILSAAP